MWNTYWSIKFRALYLKPIAKFNFLCAYVHLAARLQCSYGFSSAKNMNNNNGLLQGWKEMEDSASRKRKAVNTGVFTEAKGEFAFWKRVASEGEWYDSYLLLQCPQQYLEQLAPVWEEDKDWKPMDTN